ncbi:hypothetical protein [Mobiluncus mulieris]|uniref:hypothetical protein n=1 Tax=Mobiluncus mulieris TaxID=2052 RepID=UPI001B8C9DA3|nr:hypothetical protein [Mobiluncus mulieris]
MKRFRGGDAQARMGWWCGILYVSRETFGFLSSEALVGAAITASPFAEFWQRQQIVAVASRLHTVTVAMCGLCPRATAWRFMVYRHFS